MTLVYSLGRLTVLEVGAREGKALGLLLPRWIVREDGLQGKYRDSFAKIEDAIAYVRDERARLA